MACLCLQHTNKTLGHGRRKGTAGRAQVLTVDRVVWRGQYKPNMRHGDREPSCLPSSGPSYAESKPPHVQCPHASPTHSLLSGRPVSESCEDPRGTIRCLVCLLLMLSSSLHARACPSFRLPGRLRLLLLFAPPVHPAELSGPQ